MCLSMRVLFAASMILMVVHTAPALQTWITMVTTIYITVPQIGSLDFLQQSITFSATMEAAILLMLLPRAAFLYASGPRVLFWPSIWRVMVIWICFALLTTWVQMILLTNVTKSTATMATCSLPQLILEYSTLPLLARVQPIQIMMAMAIST